MTHTKQRTRARSALHLWTPRDGAIENTVCGTVVSGAHLRLTKYHANCALCLELARAGYDPPPWSTFVSPFRKERT